MAEHGMDSTALYLAMDRRQALAHGAALPERADGAALFADISGFTPLTEALVRTLGAQRGAEELTRQLNLVFDALIDEVNNYGGSVIAFSGDAITCWFDADDGMRATASALAMQAAMAQFAAVPLPQSGTLTLAMKASVAVGPVSRFAVGDPAIQRLDVLAGETLERLARAEHIAQRGEVVLDPRTSALLAERLHITAWRDDDGHCAVVGGLRAPVPRTPWQMPSDDLPEADVRLFVLPSVYERVRTGRGVFLAELRPAVALFLSFGGIDYDADPDARVKLDAYVRWVQQVVTRYDGNVLQLNMGDKGSYFQIVFGAPIAHDDDASRAVSAALELRALPAGLSFIGDVRMGISRGRMRTGPYGGSSRRTYGVLGDDVNLAARLMQHAAPGQVLVSARVVEAAGAGFAWEPLPTIQVKGKADPIQIFTLAHGHAARGFHLPESAYALPMVGREQELALITQKLELAQQAHGQVVAITAEAGMGKSRLVAEVIRLARARGCVDYGGECQSYGANSSYLVWHDIWRDFFGVDALAPPDEQVRTLEQALAAIEPSLVPRLPLLDVALNLSIPDNDLTQSFDAKLRKTSLEALLVDCVKARAQNAVAPLLFVFEDCHWLDPLSFDLLEAIAQVAVNLPILIVMAYRPPMEARLSRATLARIVKLPHCTELELKDFTPNETSRLIEVKLAQFDQHDSSVYGARVPAELVQRISARTQGNPFYIEELLSYLHGRGLDPRNAQTLEQLELPDSLHSLILSRIDQLSESQQVTLKVASIIGRLFPFEWLWGVYPDLGERTRVIADIEKLQEMDLTPLESLEPEERYMFKHIITQEVAYENQPYATRAELHEHLGQFIEQTYLHTTEKYVDLLAYHYGRSINLAKQREYYRRAGEAAEAAYAPEAAIGYYQKALALSQHDPSLVAYRLAAYDGLGRSLIVRARYAEAIENYKAMRATADAIGDSPAQAKAWLGLSNAYSQQGEHRQALESATHAEATARAAEDPVQLAMTLELKGRSLFRLGDTDAALALGEQILALTRAIGERRQMARGLNLLGATHNILGQYGEAETAWQRALTIFQELGDRSQGMTVLNNLGVIASARGDYHSAIKRYQEVLTIAHEIGNRKSELLFLSNLGAAQVRFHEYQAAESNLGEVIRAAQLNGTDANADTYNFLAEAYLGQGKVDEAQGAARHALALAQRSGQPSEIGAAWRVLGLVAARLSAPLVLANAEAPERDGWTASDCFAESARIFAERRMEGERSRTLRAWARYELEHGNIAHGTQLWQESRETFARLGAEFEVERMAAMPAAQTN